MLDMLRAERPGDGVLGEEGADVGGGGARRWLLDPVDGTLNFARGLPAWCSAVALVDAPARWPARSTTRSPTSCSAPRAGRGRRWTARRCALRAARSGAGGRGRGDVRRRAPARRRDHRAGRRRCCAASARLRAVGCGTLELAWVAAGRLHGWVQADVEPWDWHPGALLVARRAGWRGWRAAGTSPPPRGARARDARGRDRLAYQAWPRPARPGRATSPPTEPPSLATRSAARSAWPSPRCRPRRSSSPTRSPARTRAPR